MDNRAIESLILNNLRGFFKTETQRPARVDLKHKSWDTLWKDDQESRHHSTSQPHPTGRLPCAGRPRTGSHPTGRVATGRLDTGRVSHPTGRLATGRLAPGMQGAAPHGQGGHGRSGRLPPSRHPKISPRIYYAIKLNLDFVLEKVLNFELVLQQHLLFGVSGWRGKRAGGLEGCHSFLFYGSCRKRILIRDNSMPKIILSFCVQCVIQKREVVLLPKYEDRCSPVTTIWYPVRPCGTQSSISKNYIIATKIIHLYPFQQKLYRPTSLLGHGTEVAILFVVWPPLWLKHLDYLWNYFLIMSGAIHEHPVIDSKIIDWAKFQQRLYTFLAGSCLCDG